MARIPSHKQAGVAVFAIDLAASVRIQTVVEDFRFIEIESSC